MRDPPASNPCSRDSQSSCLLESEGSVLALVGGSVTKRRLFELHLKGLGCHDVGVVHLSPHSASVVKPITTQSPWDPFNAVVSLSERFRIVAVVPLVDSAVCVCDMLCERLGLAGNKPSTSLDRTDKERMQAACAAAGIAHTKSYRVSSLHEAISVWKTRFGSGEVVMKPPRSGGCDGVAACSSISDLSHYVHQQLNRVNLEKQPNTELVMQEFLRFNSEFVVNTVSGGGRHFVTDMWYSTPKRTGDKFVYDQQELVRDLEPLAAVVEYVKAVLDAVGVTTGACHVELAASISPDGSIADVRLIEVNGRIAGEIRTSNALKNWHRFDQIFWLLVSIFFPSKLSQLDAMPHCASPTVVVFLRNLGLAHAVLNLQALACVRGVESFFRFGRGLAWANAELNGQLVRVGRTTDLVSSPGVVILSGDTAVTDARVVRTIEANSLYLSSF